MTIDTGSDFSGVGSLDQALERLKIKQNKKFACDSDKYARETYILNFGEPEYFPKDVYEREIPKKPLDLYMTSPPCQGFSVAGKREGSILFLNSHEFIQVNKPRYFIFENVKGIYSHEKRDKEAPFGNTFNQWLNYLGGKSINGNPVIFPTEEAVPYHIYFKTLNSKEHGVPQNRERVFIVGIRDDSDNNFTWPRTEPLTKFLKDVLEENVPEKYYLSQKMIDGFISSSEKHKEKGNNFQWKPKTGDDIANCLRANGALNSTDNSIVVGFINQKTQSSKVFDPAGTSPSICAGTHGYANGYVKVKPATSSGFEIAHEGDSINMQNPNSETRRGRVGDQIAQTLDTKCHQAVVIGAIRGRGEGWKQTLEIGSSETSNTITTVQKDNVVVSGFRIRKLTPLEGFRLMDFNSSFKWNVSDSQAYKQAGNSIPVALLEKIISKFKF